MIIYLTNFFSLNSTRILEATSGVQQAPSQLLRVCQSLLPADGVGFMRASLHHAFGRLHDISERDDGALGSLPGLGESPFRLFTRRSDSVIRMAGRSSARHLIGAQSMGRRGLRIRFLCILRLR